MEDDIKLEARVREAPTFKCNFWIPVEVTNLEFKEGFKPKYVYPECFFKIKLRNIDILEYESMPLPIFLENKINVYLNENEEGRVKVSYLR